jgi:thiol-disulfide isomerase/thioredoxin
LTKTILLDKFFKGFAGFFFTSGVRFTMMQFVLFVSVLGALNSFGTSSHIHREEPSPAFPPTYLDTLRKGDIAPSFALRELTSGEPTFLRDMAGKTLREPWKKKTRYVVVLSFWATWCIPCKNEIPVITRIAKSVAEHPIKFFLVNTLEYPSTIEDSVKLVYASRGYSLPCLIDGSARTSMLYRVNNRLPMTVVIDKLGIIRLINRGFVDDGVFEKDLKELVATLAKEEIKDESAELKPEK